jgi:hypothetical protein
MGLSFETYKRLGKVEMDIRLLEVLSEVFDSTPFQSDFTFVGQLGEDIDVSTFKDPKDNNVDIHFYHDGNTVYTVDYSINGDSYQAQGIYYTLKDYTQLLATVAEAVSQFLREYSPLGLQIRGTDITAKVIGRASAEGQKDRIYRFFISQIEDQGNYMVDKSVKDGIALIRKYKQK